jgi:hypothetical protein
MTTEQIVAIYYDAWREHKGDMSAVPLADDFQFTGPCFTSALPCPRKLI